MRWLRGTAVTALVLVVGGCTSVPPTGGTGAAAAPSIPATSHRPSSAVTVPSLTTPSLTAAVSSTPRTTAPSPTTSRSTASSPATTTRQSTSRSTAPPTADLDAPGPDNGPACAVDPQYSDEAPTGLRSDVLTAWVAVKKYARTQGVALCLNDGKRSTAQQVALHDDYVREFGKAAADVYVLPPGKSAHVKGYAVDVQPAAAYQWLQGTKGARGWCRIYDNEPWHFEYARSYQRTGCPARLPKPVR